MSLTLTLALTLALTLMSTAMSFSGSVPTTLASKLFVEPCSETRTRSGTLPRIATTW